MEDETEYVDLSELPVFRAEKWEEKAKKSYIFYHIELDGKVKFTSGDMSLGNGKHASLLASSFEEFVKYITDTEKEAVLFKV